MTVLHLAETMCDLVSPLLKGSIDTIVERCVDLRRGWEFANHTPHPAAARGVVYARTGRADEALLLIASAFEDARQIAWALTLIGAGLASVTLVRFRRDF